jgi:hypothetical protein
MSRPILTSVFAGLERHHPFDELLNRDWPIALQRAALRYGSRINGDFLTAQTWIYQKTKATGGNPLWIFFCDFLSGPF